MPQRVILVGLHSPTQEALDAIQALSDVGDIAVCTYTQDGDTVAVVAGKDSEEVIRLLRDIDDLGWRDDLDEAKAINEVWLKNEQMEKPVLGRFGDYLLMSNRPAPSDTAGEKVYKQWMVVRDFDMLPIPSGSLVIPERWRHGVLIAHAFDHDAGLAEAISDCLYALDLLPEEAELVSVFGERHKLDHYKTCLPRIPHST